MGNGPTFIVLVKRDLKNTPFERFLSLFYKVSQNVFVVSVYILLGLYFHLKLVYSTRIIQLFSCQFYCIIIIQKRLSMARFDPAISLNIYAGNVLFSV